MAEIKTLLDDVIETEISNLNCFSESPTREFFRV